MKRKKTRRFKKIISFALSAAVVFTLPNAKTAAAAEREIPKSPVHQCNLDETEFSYIYFGKYPQSSISETAEIEEACKITGTGTVNGETYSRLEVEDTDSNEDDFGFNYTYTYTMYYKWEPIKWRVLEKDEENDTLLVMADKGLDAEENEYDNRKSSFSGMNSSFYSKAFSKEEKDAILAREITYAVSGWRETERSTIFLPSYEEMTNPSYGFCEDGETLSASRRVQASDYARGKGVEEAGISTKTCAWRMRSVNGGYIMSVSPSGMISQEESYIDKFACVPALYLKLSSDVWTAAEENPEESAIKNPVHNCQKNNPDTTEFGYVYFGSYPQSKVLTYKPTSREDEEDSALRKKIFSAPRDKNGDVWVDGIKYRCDKRKGIYKWERIRWRVLKNDGKTLFVMADKGIDEEAFDFYVHPDDAPEPEWVIDDERWISWYDGKSLRDWLNDDFYDMAFDRKEQEAIVKYDYAGNYVKPDDWDEGWDDDELEHEYIPIEDKLSILTQSDVQNPSYGFCKDGFSSETRKVAETDYASQKGHSDYPSYWLRPDGRKSIRKYVPGVLSDGSVCEREYFLERKTPNAVVPIMRIDLNSDLWYSVDDGSSGSGGNGGAKEEDEEKKPDNGSQGNGSGNTTNNSGNGSSSNIGQKPAGKSENLAAKPSATSLSGKIKAKSKGFTVKWKKKESVSGYQVQYSTSKKFAKKTTKTKTVKKASATSLTVKKLKAKKTYYVRVRTYVKKDGKQVFSKWSKVTRVKTKK